MAEITDTIDELTPAWFTSALREGGTIDQQTSVHAAECRRFGVGGQLATVIKAKLTYSGGPAGPASVIVKQSSTDQGSRQMGAGLGMYRAEIKFYEDVSPRVDLAAPVRYWSRLEEETGRFTLVIEDLSDTADVGDMLAGASAEQTRLALAEAARLQAPLWSDPWILEQDWLTDRTASNMLFGGVPQLIDPFVARFGDHLEADQLDLIARIGARSAECVDIIWKPPFVIGHGDYRLDNMIFGRGGDAPPVCLIDWQTATAAPPGLDIAVFLATCVDVETRRAQEKELLQLWVDRLVEGGVRDFSLDDAYESYRAASLYPLVMCVATATTLEQTERGDRMWGQLIRGAVELVRDTRAYELLT
jgi:Phosphotransferase enzyme family